MKGFLEKICLNGEIRNSDLPPKMIIPAIDELFSSAIKGLDTLRGVELQFPKDITTYLLVKDLICQSEFLPYRTKKEELEVEQLVRDYAEFNRALDTPRVLNEKEKSITEKMLRFFKTLSEWANSAQYVSTLYGQKSRYAYVF